MAIAKGPERIEKLVNALRQWQTIERKAIDSCASIMEKTENPLIRQMMEIIRNDSVQHHRVQQFIIDSLTKEQVRLTPEELGEIWDEITAHDEVERETIELAKELRKEIAERLLAGEEERDRAINDLLLEVYAEALKRKAASLGNVTEVRENRRGDDYELIIRIAE